MGLVTPGVGFVKNIFAMLEFVTTFVNNLLAASCSAF